MYNIVTAVNLKAAKLLIRKNNYARWLMLATTMVVTISQDIQIQNHYDLHLKII